MDQGNLWNITGLNAGDVNGVFFQNIENLTGGQLDDTFRFADTRGLKGKIDGGAVSNSLDYSSYLSQSVTVNLQSRPPWKPCKLTKPPTFVARWSQDTLIGANQINVWNLSASNTGTLSGLSFASFENLTGGIVHLEVCPVRQNVRGR